MTRVRLAAFAGIGVLAALQWATLLADPPTARLLGVVAVATLLGAALGRLRGTVGGPPPPGRRRTSSSSRRRRPARPRRPGPDAVRRGAGTVSATGSTSG